MKFGGAFQPQWQIFNDHHIFNFFGAPWDDLPEINLPQDKWVGYLTKFFEQLK